MEKNVAKNIAKVGKINFGIKVLIIFIISLMFLGLFIKFDDLDKDDPQSPSKSVQSKTQKMNSTSSISAQNKDGTNRTI